MTEAGNARLKRRLRAEKRFHFLGATAAFLALFALVVMLGAILVQAAPAFSRFNVRVDLTLDEAVIDPLGQRDPARLQANINGFQTLMQDALWAQIPDIADDRVARQDAKTLFTRLAVRPLAEHVARNPELVGERVEAFATVSDDVDLYLKGQVSSEILWTPSGRIRVDAMATGVGERAEWRVAKVGDDTGRKGVFVPVLAHIKEGLADQAETLTREAQAADAARIELEGRRQDLLLELTRIQALGNADVLSRARILSGSAQDSLRFAYLAGAGGVSEKLDAQLRDELGAWMDARRHEVLAEARVLEARASREDADAIRAERRSQAVHEIYRERAGRAWLEVDRRLVLSDIRMEESERLQQQDSAELHLMAELLAGRPLKGAGELFLSVEDPALLRAAVTDFNLHETAFARAAGDRAAREYAALQRRAERLEAVGRRDRADAARQLGPELSLRILRRHREARRFGQTAATISAMDAVALQAEAESQLGLNLGGDEMLAYLLGAAEYGADQNVEALRKFLEHRLQLDIDAVTRDIERMSGRVARAADAARVLRERASEALAPEKLDARQSSYLVELPGGGVIRLLEVSADTATGAPIVTPRHIALKTAPFEASAGGWRIRVIETPRVDRNVSDQEISYARILQSEGVIRRSLNWGLLTRSDSTYPELAGVAAALMGAFLTMVLTMVLSVPLGVMAAVYLEEFARRSAFTSFIELNINNLAAAPSILFGLLGAALFLNVFGFPRGAPIVGGLVLSMMTLPTVIIASRAALRSVADDVRIGALALGASRAQAVFHHVLPLAAPGIMTGAIIGISRALGETAPLLMIGMLAFVAEPPADIFDSSTVLPVLIYKWAGGAERAWLPMTAAAVVILLLFMFALNSAAVYVRRRFEKR